MKVERVTSHSKMLIAHLIKVKLSFPLAISFIKKSVGKHIIKKSVGKHPLTPNFGTQAHDHVGSFVLRERPASFFVIANW